MSTTKLVLPGLLLLAGLMLFQALLFDRHLESVVKQMPDRAPTAPPLRTLTALPERMAINQTVYVPVYSHVYGSKGREQPLETTLSIRNTDSTHAIVVKSIRYYGNEGKLLREYLEAPVILDSLASTDFLVQRYDMKGGVGANFLIDWFAEEAVTTPVIEAIMVSYEGNKAFAFARPGYPLGSFLVEEPWRPGSTKLDD